MLESYQRLRRIQTAKLRAAETDTRDCFFKKKTRHGSTCRTWSASNEYRIQGGLDRATAHSAAVIRDTAPTPNNYPPPTTSGIGKPRKAA